ncbi:RNA polymerase sigma factor [Pyxidicoccus xibeiensis]|uniref:RNA polymerase sigma factor n=1 Tax=Pyxidicoccus xibeiensis TaxID=2906759 RepID=UPI0020A74784|nr:RNA polymerase sigma factor [Pyxidicoccus xibeiensis]MCP3141821.1 RNA polymerase sigma factor [Pyxidicoccus xibeiensis]
MAPASDIDKLYREETGRILPTLIRLLGDFTLAEDALQEAFQAAVEQWPREGTPPLPRAWIIQTARHRAIDRVRRGQRLREKTALLEQALEGLSASLESAPVIADDQLRLLYTCCHPSLAPEAQVALTLRTLCGLTTEEIARAFFVPTPAMAQRIVRAQRKIRDAGVPYEVPERSELRERTRAVLATIYLTFNEGYSATGGDSLVRVDLCEEAIRLGRIVVTLLSETLRAEASAMLALMVLHHARRFARVAPDGGLVLLDQQDRTLWRKDEAEEGAALLHKALSLGARGPYAIQAAIAALHLQAETPAHTDWAQIVGLYDRLLAIDPSPIVALNRAAAVAMAEGAERGLAQIDDLAASGVLRGYHLLPASRADLLRRLGRFEEAATAYREALSLTRNDAERRFLEARLVEVSRGR